ncbi:hypothetical protein IQ277_25900 [Nostocales cyanobacterium LEGE 12452]|nr:hypothetical protein [Nostocales cyanobacterium LEGE 12452]
MAVERLDDLLGSSPLMAVERLDDLLDSALLITVERLDEERLLPGCIAGPAAGNPSTIILLLLVLLLFDAIAGPATGSASWASNRCAGKQLKLVKTTKAVAESLNFIFFNNLCFMNLLQMHATGMPNSINQIYVQTIDNCG